MEYKKLISSFLLFFIIVSSISFHAFADSLIPETRDTKELISSIEICENGRLSLTVNSLEEMILLKDAVNSHNNKVDELWQKSKNEFLSYHDPKSYIISPRYSLYSSDVLVARSNSWSWPNWSLGYYCTYYGSQSAIYSVSNVYVFDAATFASIEIENFEFLTNIIDTNRTIACNTSVRIDIYNIFGWYLGTLVLSEYMEWYISGGGYIY